MRGSKQMYEIREIELKNDKHVKRRLVITFEDPQEEIIGVFLMSDAPMYQFELIGDLEAVLSGQREPFVQAGNRCEIEVGVKETVISDLFAHMVEDAAMPSVTLKTEKLLQYIKMWQEALVAQKEK